MTERKYDAHVECGIRHNCHFEKFINKKQVFDSHPAVWFYYIHKTGGGHGDFPICDEHRVIAEEQGFWWPDAHPEVENV